MKPFEWKSRDELPFILNNLGMTGVIAEVGVERAHFTRHLRDHWKGSLVVAVDKWEVNPKYPSCTRERHLQARDEAAANIKAAGAAVEIVNAWSLDAAKDIAERSSECQIKRLWKGGFDAVYLDADHSYSAVVADIEAWLPLVRSGGILCGHDFLEEPDGWFRQMDPVHAYPTQESAGPDSWPCGVHRAVYEKFPRDTVALTSPDSDGGFRSWAIIKP